MKKNETGMYVTLTLTLLLACWGPKRALAQETVELSDQLELHLKVTKPLALVDYVYEEIHDIGLSGELMIEVKNGSDQTVELAHIHVHGLLFVDRDNERHVIVHSCDCMGLFNDDDFFKTLVLGPGESGTIVIADWGCNSMWNPPEMGEYQITYRVLSADDLRRKARERRGLERQKCAEVFTSDDFWTGAATSNTLRITLEAPRREVIEID